VSAQPLALSALRARPEKDRVTVSGLIVEAKRFRTRKGDPMTFATLRDIDGEIEMLAFGKALAEHETALSVGEVVSVRGRVDHHAGKTCLVVQTVEAVPPPSDRTGEGER
jgi:DNA polymerase III subunit alpha